MATVVLPRDCTLDRLMTKLDAAGAFSGEWESLFIHLPDPRQAHPPRSEDD